MENEKDIFKFSEIDKAYDGYFGVKEVFGFLLDLEYAYNYYMNSETEFDGTSMDIYFFFKVLKEICFKQACESGK